MSEQTDRGGKKKKDEWLSWALIVVLFAIGLWPIGLAMLLFKLYGRDSGTRRTADSRGSDQRRKETAAPTGRAAQAARKIVRTPDAKKSTAWMLKLFGIILAAVGLVLAKQPVDALFWSSYWTSIYLGRLLQALSLAVAGGAMLFSGISMDRAMARYARCAALAGEREAICVEELAKKLGRNPRQTARDLQRMIEKNYFGPQAYLDHDLGYLFRSDEAAQRLRRESAAPEPAAPQETEEGYSGILRNIRRANDRIADPELSAKIDRLEEITGRIFRAVEADPAKRNRIGTLLNYYLPTTQKLLDTYAEFESTGVEGENLRTAKERIRATMDAIVAGFEHQLDELYQADAMDVDSDIRVMESMLHRDTASAERDFGLGTAPAAPGTPAVRRGEDSAGEADPGGTAAQTQE